MENPSTNSQLEAQFIKDTQASVPDIIKNLNPVTEQFDSVSQGPEQMRILPASQNDPSFIHRLLTKAEQAICDMATD